MPTRLGKMFGDIDLADQFHTGATSPNVERQYEVLRIRVIIGETAASHGHALD